MGRLQVEIKGQVEGLSYQRLVGVSAKGLMVVHPEKKKVGGQYM